MQPHPLRCRIHGGIPEEERGAERGAERPTFVLREVDYLAKLRLWHTSVYAADDEFDSAPSSV
jgi:hypothetical protein